jgi:hypothetical protein
VAFVGRAHALNSLGPMAGANNWTFCFNWFS